MRLQHVCAAEGQDFIKVKDAVMIAVEDDTLVGVFSSNFLTEFSYADIFIFKLILLHHPIAEGCSQGHSHDGEIGVNPKTGLAVFRRAFDEPSLL